MKEVVVQNIWQVRRGGGGSPPPLDNSPNYITVPTKRSPEELKQIKDDFILIKKMWDEELEGLESGINIFNDKSRKEEITEFHSIFLNTLEELYNSGKIKSCEGLTCLENVIKIERGCLEDYPSWEFWGVNVKSSDEVKPAGGLSLDEIVERLKNRPYSGLLNRDLDKIGKDACMIRACSESELNLDWIETEYTLPDLATDPKTSKKFSLTMTLFI